MLVSVIIIDWGILGRLADLVSWFGLLVGYVSGYDYIVVWTALG